MMRAEEYDTAAIDYGLTHFSTSILHQQTFLVLNHALRDLFLSLVSFQQQPKKNANVTYHDDTYQNLYSSAP